MRTVAFIASVVLFVLTVLASERDYKRWKESRGVEGHWREDFPVFIFSMFLLQFVVQVYVPTWVSYFRGDCWGIAPWHQWAKYAFVGYYAVRLFLHGRFTRRHDRLAARVAKAARQGKRSEFRMLLEMLLEMIVRTYELRYIYAVYVGLAVLAMFYTC